MNFNLALHELTYHFSFAAFKVDYGFLPVIKKKKRLKLVITFDYLTFNRLFSEKYSINQCFIFLLVVKHR